MHLSQDTIYSNSTESQCASEAELCLHLNVFHTLLYFWERSLKRMSSAIGFSPLVYFYKRCLKPLKLGLNQSAQQTEASAWWFRSAVTTLCMLNVTVYNTICLAHMHAAFWRPAVRVRFVFVSVQLLCSHRRCSGSTPSRCGPHSSDISSFWLEVICVHIFHCNEAWTSAICLWQLV